MTRRESVIIEFYHIATGEPIHFMRDMFIDQFGHVVEAIYECGELLLKERADIDWEIKYD